MAIAEGLSMTPSASVCSGSFSGEESLESTTTVMFRNLPCKYSQEDLKAMLDGAGFRGSFDLIYMPRSAVKQSNFGYAYVNFRTSQTAVKALTRLNGHPVHDGRREKGCTVSLAHVQGGLEAMPERRRRCKPGCRAEPLIINDVPETTSDSNVAYVKVGADLDEGLKDKPLKFELAAPMKVQELQSFGLGGNPTAVQQQRQLHELYQMHLQAAGRGFSGGFGSAGHPLVAPTF